MSSLDTFDSLYEHLTLRNCFPVFPASSPKPYEKEISHSISSLSIHPTLEAILHILNNDLPSAHFLCRHMQSEPAWEGMYIHGILHRVEGDYRNAEAWYRDVAGSECFKAAWPEGLEASYDFIGSIERLKKEGRRDAAQLEKISRREIDAVVGWCKKKFGTEKLGDATAAWVEPSEKIREIAAKQAMGGEGWRTF